MNHILLYNPDDLKIFLDTDCNEIVSFVIGPIHKLYYEFICYEIYGTIKLLYSEISIEKMLDFAKSYCLPNTTFDELRTKINKEPLFVETYKKGLMKNVEVSYLKEMILTVNEFRTNGNKIKNFGFDGLSMDCKIFRSNEFFHIKDYSDGEGYKPVIELANILLEKVGVDSNERFIIIN